jgi:hypothetical protein
MYLYGNEQVIPNDWSKVMISNEADHCGKRIVDDDDWHTFLENEPINDAIKWNFASKHGQSWQVTQLNPIKLDTLEDNIRFRSALRRSNITFHTRMTTVTAQIYQWFDECLEYGYIHHEVYIRIEIFVKYQSLQRYYSLDLIQRNQFLI